MEHLQVDEELEIGVLLDLLHQFFICNPKARLDDQGAQRHLKRLGTRSKALAELRRIVIFQFIPGNELSELDPAIVTREFAAKRQEEILKRELVTMLTPIMWKTLGGFSVGLGRFAHILPPRTALIHCGASNLTLFRKPEVRLAIVVTSVTLLAVQEEIKTTCSRLIWQLRP